VGGLGGSPEEPFDEAAQHKLNGAIIKLLAGQQKTALHEIANAMAGAGVRKTKLPKFEPDEGDGGIWVGVGPGTPDSIAGITIDYGVNDRNLAIIRHELETAARVAGDHTGRQVTAPDGLMTREQQDKLRAQTVPMENNVRFWSRRYARERAAEMVGKKYVGGQLVDNPNAKWSISDTTRETLRDIIAKAISHSWNMATIEAKITQSGIFSPSRAEMIARTEINRARNSSVLEAARVAQDAGVGKYSKQWTLGDNPCVYCQENAAEGEIELDEFFASGDDSPPLHPHCECDLDIIEKPDDEA
jgi:hypothetical protein